MNTDNSDQPKQTVLITADVSSYSITSVELALRLAASVDSRLQGLFVEDEDLLQVSGLPCTREITLTTARERPTSADQMQRSLRSVAEQFKQSLEREARALKIAWSFDTVRGRAQEIGKQSGRATYTVFDSARPYRLAPRPAVSPRKILLVPNGSRHELHALKIVLDRFFGEKIDLTLILAEDNWQTKDEVSRLVGARVPQVKIHEVKAGEVSNLLDRTGSSFDCAIVSRNEQADLLARILSKLSCPIVLVA